MDARKVKTVVTDNGKVVTKSRRFGSGYKNESILTYRTENLSQDELLDPSFLEAHNNGFNISCLIEDFEKRIIETLKKLDLPFEDAIGYSDDGEVTSIDILPEILRRDYFHVAGAHQLSRCLFELRCCKDDLRKEDYKMGMVHAFRLIDHYGKLVFALNEAKIGLGNYKQTTEFSDKSKLTYEQLLFLFEYYESILGSTAAHKIGKCWELTKKKCEKELEIQISTRTLREAYKKYKK